MDLKKPMTLKENSKRLFLKPEEVNPKEIKELKALRKEALSGECISFEDLLKKHGASKKIINSWKT
jgi:hypothetical protein